MKLFYDECFAGRHNIQVINYLQNEEVERHRRTRLSQHPDVDQPVDEKQALEVPRDFRYDDVVVQSVWLQMTPMNCKLSPNI